MAKTVRKEDAKKNVKTETKNENKLKDITEPNPVIFLENDDDEKIVVNEKNEIIFNPEEELEKIMEPLKSNIGELEINENIKEGIEFIKNNIEIPPMENIEEATNFAKKQINEIEKIKSKITKKNINNSYNFTNFWNGVSQ